MSYTINIPYHPTPPHPTPPLTLCYIIFNFYPLSPIPRMVFPQTQEQTHITKYSALDLAQL